MATERLIMRHTREILRQKFTLSRSHRAIAQSLGISSGAVGATALRARGAGLDWPQVQALTDDALEARLYGRPEVAGGRQRPLPDCAYLHAERRKPGVTLELLHLEYLEQHPDGYRYTRFCDLYRRWLTRRGRAMRQVHHGGEKLFVDYAGQKPAFIDPATGKRIFVELFVAVLGASNYTYAEATLTQQVPDWIASHQRAFAFVGGVTVAVVCDQLKSGVVIPCRYEPGLQRTYEELAQQEQGGDAPRQRVRTPEDAITPEEEIKDPYVLEFLGLKDEYSAYASVRSGTGSTCSFSTDECLVIVDLKLGEFTHADAGQMHLYLTYAHEHWMLPGENPPVGLILCAQKDTAVAHYALEGLPNKVLAAEYRMALPNERLLADEIKKTRQQLEGRTVEIRGEGSPAAKNRALRRWAWAGHAFWPVTHSGLDARVPTSYARGVPPIAQEGAPQDGHACHARPHASSRYSDHAAA
jgi:transposase